MKKLGARKQAFAIMLVFVFLLAGLIPFTVMGDTTPKISEIANPGTRYMPRDLDRMVEPITRTMGAEDNVDAISPSIESKFISSDSNTYVVGDKAYYWVGDWGKWAYNDSDPTGYMTFTLRADTPTVEIWVADDLSFMWWDSRNDDPEMLEVTDAQIQYVVNEWNTKIYPKTIGLIGEPNERDGRNCDAEYYGDPSLFPTDQPEKIMMMIFNIADDSFFDPTLEYFGQGFFSPFFADNYNRNIIHVSSYDWKDRLGVKTGDFAHQYEYIISHELEHLINNAYNPWQEAFLDEGCAELCPILLGYGLNLAQISKINDFLATPDNSLTIFYDQWTSGNAADYGASLLFVLYLYDHFGTKVLRSLVDTQEHGIAAVDEALKDVGKRGWDFNKVFQNWRLANLMHTDKPGNGLYNYRSIDLSSPDLIDLSVKDYSPSNVPWVDSASQEFGNTLSRGGYDTGVSELGPYSTDYIRVQGENGWASELDKRKLKMFFDGGEAETQGWQRYASGYLPDDWAIESKNEVKSPWVMERRDPNGYDYFMQVSTLMNKSEIEPFPISDEWLYMTKGFSTIDYESATLSFDSYYFPGWPESTCDVMVSTDGGANFVTILTLTTAQWDWETVSVDLTSVLGQSDVRLAFRLYDVSTPGVPSSMLMDNVVVSNSTGTMIYQQDFNNYRIDSWWSDSRDYADYSLVGMVNLKKSTSATLEIDTKWGMWYPEDFGFIQVSIDRGATWTSLSNDYTWSENRTDIMPIMVENAPFISGRWLYDQGWITLTFDISQYSGHELYYRFRYISDSSLNLEGWFIKDIRINGETVDPTTLRTDPSHPKDDWMVTVYFPECRGVGGRYLPSKIVNLDPCEGYESAMLRLSRYTMYKEMYIIVSNTYGTNDYGFGVGAKAGG